MDGTALNRFKDHMYTRLDLTILTVLRDSPDRWEEALGADGSGAACWFDDQADITYQVTVYTGGSKWIDETVTAKLIIQVLGMTSDDDQRTVDATASAMLNTAIAVCLDDPALGTVDDQIEMYTALPSSCVYKAQHLASGARAARFELEIVIESRLKLEVP